METKAKAPISWIKSPRKATTASQENRAHPRVDCDCPAIIAGYSGLARVTDFSLGGCFVECDSGLVEQLQTGKVLNLAVKFPTEDQMLDFEVKILRTANRGVACEFVSLKQQKMEPLKRFFDFAQETQPLF